MLCLYGQHSTWQLVFNVEKCKIINFGRNNEEYQYTMHFEDIESVEEEKDLGVIFQKDLKFSNHIASKVNKANSSLSLVTRGQLFKTNDVVS